MDRINTLFKLHVENPVDVIPGVKNHVLAKENIHKGIVAFISTLGKVATLSKCYYFIKDETTIEDILPDYIKGLNLLLTIGKQLHIDELKGFQEIPETHNAIEQFLIVNEGALQLTKSYEFKVYQNVVDDYLIFGVLLGLSMDDIVKGYGST